MCFRYVILHNERVNAFSTFRIMDAYKLETIMKVSTQFFHTVQKEIPPEQSIGSLTNRHQ